MRASAAREATTGFVPGLPTPLGAHPPSGCWCFTNQVSAALTVASSLSSPPPPLDGRLGLPASPPGVGFPLPGDLSPGVSGRGVVFSGGTLTSLLLGVAVFPPEGWSVLGVGTASSRDGRFFGTVSDGF